MIGTDNDTTEPKTSPASRRRRYAFRPELSLLYDRLGGLEHRLNPTAVKLVSYGFDDDLDLRLAQLSAELAVPAPVLRRDFDALWADIDTAPEKPQPLRKSGAPMEWAAVDIPFPLVLELELTRLCNWHCDFCYNVWKVSDDYGRRSRSDTRRLQAAHLPLASVRSILDEAARNDCLRIRFSGGEPTLHPDFAEIVTYAGSLGFDIEVFTNGTRLTADLARTLAENGTRVVLVSIHGLERSHNQLTQNGRAFTAAMAAVDESLAAGLHTVVETLVTGENVEEIPTLVVVLAGKGVEHVSLMPYVPAGPKDVRTGVPLAAVRDVIAACRERAPSVGIRVPCAPRHCLSPEPVPVDTRVDWEFDDHCAAGTLWASIAYDGRIRHCPHSSVYAGSVDEGIGQVWRERVVPTVRAALVPQGACVSCSQIGPCQGGCHLGRVTSYPSTDGQRSDSDDGGAGVPVTLTLTRKGR